MAFTAAFTSCKPTERNYREAYDLARSKREKTMLETGAPGFLQTDQGIRLSMVGNDSVWISDQLAQPVDPVTRLGNGERAYGVAISKYRMATNANAQASDLRKGGEDPTVARDGEGNHYVLIAVAPTEGKALEAMRAYMVSNPGTYFVGLPGRPILIRLRGKGLQKEGKK